MGQPLTFWAIPIPVARHASAVYLNRAELSCINVQHVSGPARRVCGSEAVQQRLAVVARREQLPVRRYGEAAHRRLVGAERKEEFACRDAVREHRAWREQRVSGAVGQHGGEQRGARPSPPPENTVSPASAAWRGACVGGVSRSVSRSVSARAGPGAHRIDEVAVPLQRVQRHEARRGVQDLQARWGGAVRGVASGRYGGTGRGASG